MLKTYENHLLLDTVSSKIAHIRLDMEQTNSNATNVATNIKQTLRMDDNDNNSQYILLKCYVSSQKVIFQYFIYKSSTLHSNTHGLADTFWLRLDIEQTNSNEPNISLDMQQTNITNTNLKL